MGKGNECFYLVCGKKVYTKFLLKPYRECDNAILHNQILQDSFLIMQHLFFCYGLIACSEGQGHFN